MPNIKTHALSSYSADVVDMLRAFKVVDAGLVPDFTLEGTYNTGIVMAANILQYNDDVDYVDITAKLYLVNTNGSKVALPTSFDGVDAKYDEYRVRKPEPIADLVATP